MYLFLMLASIIVIVTLMGIIVMFAYNILRNKKTLFSWFSLTIIAFFLVLGIWQGMRFLNLA